MRSFGTSSAIPIPSMRWVTRISGSTGLLSMEARLRFEGIESARALARLFAAARLHVNFFQPSFKLKEKRREGAKIIKCYHAPATPCERALAHPALAEAVKCKLRGLFRRLDPLAILAEMRSAQV